MGYTSQQFLLLDSSSDANFRVWGSAISAALTSMGWAMTADTGQVNWTTVTAPAAGTFVYEIWEPQDALQTGGTVFYLKLEYSKTSGSPAGIRVRASLGTGTNGSGTLTGFVTSAMETAGTQAALSFSVECDFSGDTDRMGFILGRGSAAGTNAPLPAAFFIERTKNSDGTNSSDGVTLVSRDGNNSGTFSGVQQTIVFGVGLGNLNTSLSLAALANGGNASDAFNNNIPVSPLFPIYGKYGNPMTTLCFVHTQDVAEGCLFTTTLYGVTRTYLACGTFRGLTVPANCRTCMRYD